MPGIRPLTSDPGFNGWVYADGAIYSGRDFPDAYVAFGGVGGKFSVPDVHDFIRLNGSAGRDGNSFSPVIYENSVSSHTHGDIDSAQLKNYGKAAVIGVSVPVCNGAGAPAPGRGLRTGYRNRVSAVALSVSIGSVDLMS